MTTSKATMALAELSEKGADVDLLREMIRHIVMTHRKPAQVIS